jgi:hypothetical protein
MSRCYRKIKILKIIILIYIFFERTFLKIKQKQTCSAIKALTVIVPADRVERLQGFRGYCSLCSRL